MSTSDAPVGLNSNQLDQCQTVEALVQRLRETGSRSGHGPDAIPWLEAGSVTEMDWATFRRYIAGSTTDSEAVTNDSPCFLLLWKVRRRCFARQLTRAEARRFCELLMLVVE